LAGPFRHSFCSPQPCSDTLGDACSAAILHYDLTRTRRRGLATVTLPPQIHCLLVGVLFFRSPGLWPPFTCNCSPRTTHSFLMGQARDSTLKCGVIPR